MPSQPDVKITILVSLARMEWSLKDIYRELDLPLTYYRNATK